MRNVAASVQYSYPLKNIRALLSIISGAHRRFDKLIDYEKKFGELENCPFSIATSMGRIALFHIIRSLNIQPGDKILLSPVNIPEMLAIIASLRLEPVFVDLEEKSLFISPSDLEKKASNGAKAFFLTYIAGQIGDLAAIRTICNKYRITLIQDCTQANQCYYQNKPLPAWADYTFFSTCEFKYIHTYRGAVICCSSAEHFDKLKLQIETAALSQKTIYLLKKWITDCLISIVLNPTLFSAFFYRFGSLFFTQNPLAHLSQYRSSSRFLTLLGNDYDRMKQNIPPYMLYRASNFEALIGIEAIGFLHQRIMRHQSIAARYIAAFEQLDILPKISKNSLSSYWRFPIIFSSPTKATHFKHAMRQAGITVEKTGLSLLSQNVPQARQIIDNTLFIPCHENLTDSDVDRIIQTTVEILASL